MTSLLSEQYKKMDEQSKYKDKSIIVTGAHS